MHSVKNDISIDNFLAIQMKEIAGTFQ